MCSCRQIHVLANVSVYIQGKTYDKPASANYSIESEPCRSISLVWTTTRECESARVRENGLEQDTTRGEKERKEEKNRKKRKKRSRIFFKKKIKLHVRLERLQFDCE